MAPTARVGAPPAPNADPAGPPAASQQQQDTLMRDDEDEEDEIQLISTPNRPQTPPNSASIAIPPLKLLRKRPIFEINTSPQKSASPASKEDIDLLVRGLEKTQRFLIEAKATNLPYSFLEPLIQGIRAALEEIENPQATRPLSLQASTWANIATQAGPKGPEGPPAYKGLKGPKGPPASKGLKGPKDPIGSKGTIGPKNLIGPFKASDWTTVLPRKGAESSKGLGPKSPTSPKATQTKEGSQVILKLKKEGSTDRPKVDSLSLRNQLNSALSTIAISTIELSARGNLVITTRAPYTAKQLLASQGEWQQVFAAYPIESAETPTSWTKLVAHGVPILADTDILGLFQQEAEAFNPIEVKGAPRWLRKPRSGQQAGSIVFAVPTEDQGSYSLRKGLSIAGVNTMSSLIASTSFIKLIQHNANKQDIAHQTVFQQAYETHTDILLIQEPACPKAPSGSFIGLQHPAYYLITPQPAPSPSDIAVRPRVLAYIRKASQLEFTPRYDLFSDPDIQAIEVIGPETFLIVNLYNEKERNLDPSPIASGTPQQRPYTVDRLLLPSRFRLPTLLVGDFNLHHARWNSAADPSREPKARGLVNWLDSQQARLLVDPEEINEKGGTFYRAGLKTTSVIDLAFYTPFRKLDWASWHYLEPSGSDHEVIAFEARLSQPPTNSLLFNSRPPLFNYKKADWEKFSRLLARKEAIIARQIESLSDKKDFEGIASSLSKEILEAAEASIPRQRPSERSKPWWTPQLASLRKSLNRALRSYKRYLTSELEEDWKTVRNSYFISIRQAKQTYWENFLQDAIKEDIFKAYSYTKPRQSTTIPSIRYTRDNQEEIAKTFNEKCNAFLSTLFPTPSLPNRPIEPQNLAVPPGQLGSKALRTYKWDWPELEGAEVGRAIFSSSNKKAPGPDSIGFLLLQKTYRVIPAILNKAYKTLFTEGYHPSSWKEGIGIILPKAKKKDYSSPKSYRVIALLNCLGKVLEKLYATRLSFLANTSSLLHSSQLGGRKQRSAIDTALLLVHHIEQQRLSRKVASSAITTTLFLDIKGAFDHVSRDKLLGVLERLSLPRALISWVGSFLSNRKIQLAFEGQIQQLGDIAIGIPQGSPISPILFLLYVRDIIADKAYQLSYIDDFSLSISSTSAYKNCRALEGVVASLIEEAESQGVQFDPGKTELIHFSTQRKPIDEGVSIAGQAITPKPIVRWLGIWFDSKLTFRAHIEKRINQATAAFEGLQRLSSTQKGLSFRALRQLYIACITTIADYGVPIWYRGPRQKALVQLYQRLQNQALPRILGAFRGSPTRALELEAAIPPPEVRFEKACLGYALRTILFQNSHPIRQAYNLALRDELAGSESDLATISYVKPTTQLLSLLYRLKVVIGPNWNIERQRATWQAPWAREPILKTTISSSSKEQAKKEHLGLLESLEFDNCALFYTDGSQGTYKGLRTNSCSFCELSLSNRPISTKSWNLGPSIEVADAELIAISKVLLALLARPQGPRPLEVYIFVDSQAAIAKVSGYSDIAYRVRATLAQLATYKVTVTISWCPSHVGIFGNELADQLAKKGLEASLAGSPYVSLSYLRRKVRETSLASWRDLWDSEEARETIGLRARGLGKHYRKVVKDAPRFSFKPNLASGERPIQSAFIQLKLGIGYLMTYQKIIKKRPTNRCLCGQPQTASHLLLYCSRYRPERERMEKALAIGQPLNLQSLYGSKDLYG
ncbi:hypothetical protein Egran_07099 [Elaphomyces granulatus]|uniref:Reverse transcriptase domain-containing protein n=1 Tax=Elaphomyces granulatus TaxID=519963 RepID=A0A232LLV3_9EURO|nr:hypothetical protein Egran_07099 [Elaphomyces granulatus]